MKIAMLFPGYGSQYLGMGQDIYLEYPIIRQRFKEASDHLGIDFERLCFSSSEAELKQIEHAYLSIFLLSCSLYDVLREIGIEPTVLAGYDTGQYAALYASHSIPFLDGLSILKTYGNFYMSLLNNNSYALLRINGLTDTKLPEYLDKRTFIAACQARTQHLVAGTKEGIEDLREKLKRASRATLYDEPLGLGLNCKLMNPLLEIFVPYLRTITFNTLTIPVISNVNGKYVTNGQQIKEEIIKLINSPLRWDKVIDSLANIDLVIGMGTQESLLDLVTDKYPDKLSIAINQKQDLDKLKGYLLTFS